MQEISKNYTDELFDNAVYSELARMEKDPELAKTLSELSRIELKHAGLWKAILEKKGLEPKAMGAGHRLRVRFYKVFRKLFGPALTVRLLEASEEQAIKKYRELINSDGFGGEEKAILGEILKDELSHEEALIDQDLRVTGVKETIYGISDGVVEVLAAVSGFAGIFVSPFLVAVAGFIVGTAGTLSMTVGAYLSAKSEEDATRSGRRKLENQLELDRSVITTRVKAYLEGKGFSRHLAETAASQMSSDNESVKKLFSDGEEVSARKAAFTTGVSYVVGFIPVVLPYALGIGGTPGLAVAYTLSAIWLAVVGYLVGISSGVSPWRKSGEMVFLGIATALLTHGLGLLASHYLHITV